MAIKQQDRGAGRSPPSRTLSHKGKAQQQGREEPAGLGLCVGRAAAVTALNNGRRLGSGQPPASPSLSASLRSTIKPPGTKPKSLSANFLGPKRRSVPPRQELTEAGSAAGSAGRRLCAAPPTLSIQSTPWLGIPYPARPMSGISRKSHCLSLNQEAKLTQAGFNLQQGSLFAGESVTPAASSGPQDSCLADRTVGRYLAPLGGPPRPQSASLKQN